MVAPWAVDPAKTRRLCRSCCNFHTARVRARLHLVEVTRKPAPGGPRRGRVSCSPSAPNDTDDGWQPSVRAHYEAIDGNYRILAFRRSEPPRGARMARQATA